jgi:hypothetical protein
MPVNRVENHAREFVFFKQSAEFQERRCVRGRLAIEVDSEEATNRLAIVNRVFDTFIRQAKALLRDIHAEHARQPDRWTAGAFHLWIMRLDQIMQSRLRRHSVDLREEAVTPCQLLFGGVFEVGKTLLHDQLNGGRGGRYCRRSG